MSVAIKPELYSIAEADFFHRVGSLGPGASLTESSNSSASGTLSHTIDYAQTIVRRLSSDGNSVGSRNEMLSLALGFVYSWSDAEKIADQLLERFGSLGAVIAASHEKLSAALPNPDPCFALLRVIHRLLGNLLREPLEAQTFLRTTSELEEYLRHTLAHEEVEMARLLFLNTRNALIRDELHARGTLNHTPIYPREVLKRAVELGASALIVVHNHPSGDPTPSRSDVEMTQKLEQALRLIEVSLHDHVIVGKRRCVSMRQLKLIGVSA
jgi:DNA repair protein RadC